MSEAAMLLSEATTASEVRRAGGRTRTCVGCNERVEILSAGPARLIRFILGPGGEVAVDPKGGGFGRGAHVHPRRECVERAARAGLLRATKGAARTVVDAGESGIAEPLAAAALARAIQRSMDRRVEGLLATAVRSRQLARGADAVTGACQRGEAALVVVACDAAAAADLTEVRRAVAEGRAVAWGTKERLGAIVAPRAVRSRLGAPPEPHGRRDRLPDDRGGAPGRRAGGKRRHLGGHDGEPQEGSPSTSEGGGRPTPAAREGSEERSGRPSRWGREQPQKRP
jgi:predicted RNA-binding protein YlxR (DUF448 family)/ribosomal protein L7Ae-like RNA K-turn-binding protein